MNKNIKYIVEDLFNDFYDEQTDIITDFLGYKYFPEYKDELREIIKDHYKSNTFNLNDIDVSQITDFSELFYEDNNTAYENFDISHWDVSNGEDFNNMFFNCRYFNCDLSKWDVSNGKNFAHMFNSCEVFNSDLSKWNVKNGEFFDCMFNNCQNFNSNLSQWDVSNGKNFKYMFSGCYMFNSDLSKCNISSDYVKRSYDVIGMFKNCYSINYEFIPKRIYNDDELFDAIDRTEI